MENIPVQPTVFITPEGQNYKPPRNWKPLILILLAVFIIGGLSFTGFYYRSKLNINNISAPVKRSTTEPKIIGKGKVSDLAASKDHPAFFYADLEYDPKTDITTQLKTGKMNGDQLFLLPSPPPDTDTKFIYKVELSDQRGIWQTGWGMTYKELGLTPKGTIKFTIVTNYKPGFLAKVYLPNNKLIWSGEIK